MTMLDPLYLFDTTLRDGAQTQGVDFSVEDKAIIAKTLDRLGIDYIEAGWPGANPTDTAFYANPPSLSHAKLVAFGMTRRPGRSTANDPGLKTLLDSQAEAVCIVGKSWDFHVDVALGITNEENLKLIGESIAAIAREGREPIFDSEHFFDGYKANPEFALSCLKAALDNGARWAVLCDTNGGTLPHEVTRIVTEVTQHIPGRNLGLHCHNDTGNAVANSLAAVRAGVRQVQGTLNGLGERCGNADIVSLIPTFALKPGFVETVKTNVSETALAELTPASRLLDELLNRAPNRGAPYVGASAFAHKGGLHVSAVQKDPRTYEHIDPQAVGNRRRIVISDQAGRSNVLARLAELGIDLPARDPRVDRILAEVKDREFKGYSYDAAEASFEIIVRRILGELPTYFTVESFRVLSERRHNARGQLITVSEATVKLLVDGQRLISVGEGEGPVAALDVALRKDLGIYSRYIEDLRLVDYKVRILNQSGTESTTRVLIESADGAGNRWFTVGVSPNIVDASYQAMHDSLTYKFYRGGAPAPAPKAAARIA